MIKGLKFSKMLGYILFLHNICGFCQYKLVFNAFVPGLVMTGSDQFLVVFGRFNWFQSVVFGFKKYQGLVELSVFPKGHQNQDLTGLLSTIPVTWTRS